MPVCYYCWGLHGTVLLRPPTLWPYFREWCPCRCREAGPWLGFVLELPGEGGSCLRGPSAERCPWAPPG